MPAILNLPDLFLGDTLPSFSFDLEMEPGQVVESASVCLQSVVGRMIYRWASPLRISIVNNKLTMVQVNDTSEWPAGEMVYVTRLVLTGGVRRTLLTGSMKIIRLAEE